ncbi:uncharacterized protein LOC114930412 [Nylanderia fulva]|uniref:uncharacterized protein LOC114930412 n=1 Tax=Nylanderia fulva TaxID=613905 RepID=UPI0010FB644D|nr:uncharacterized protein LOC114930412 [Nylanderia fulva]XP_029158006.1 uncharacterized protein LOC114930412 [Nylanderia fulva]XP_029158007.1 uncharacterized protein LOC114930412 [Nylanderia fulva]XP_029158009.1 uncharacterized protein LOC114930412 [Nylanderia fulva]XP_029158010.1 uncharacterized protein LOC114930412 [Nylanderia fulva]XP_029158011.1 uncharacterized protein LOC114930412 [Nylanderia fulva]XP_029158012.1 uncharacterized protein LOC114930412 [Nylanderia fulva]XP_029158013.1 unc
MNEVRHVLTALRSPSKNLTLSNGTPGVATTTWYDVPAPIIVHCREFHEEASHDVVENGEEPEVGSVVKDTESLEKDTRAKVTGRPLSMNEALYQNKEAILNDKNRNRKRHSTTLELNATAKVETDADGVPTISFSFLRTDEKDFHEDGDEIVILEVDTSDQTKDSASENQLYDLPKSAPSRVSLERSDDKETSVEFSSSVTRQVLYDMPAAKDASLNGERETMTPSNVSLNERSKQQRDQTKRSTRSLKSGRRSYGASDSDGYDAGIASMSGSYSDPECPNEEGSVSGGSARSRRMKLQKRRLGKAWGRMRSWLREEKIRIGEVVNRHARLQAVGALNPEVRDDTTRTSKSKQRGFYDLTRARTQESGSITRVEEFGLSSVSEEANVSDEERPTSFDRGNLKRKTASSDDILENSRTRLQLPVSFSVDKLCSNDLENDPGTRTSSSTTPTTPTTTMTTTAPTEISCETSRDAGKGGLIKRRMLGSIRGLMASTHLLQTYEIEEVPILCALGASL